MAELTKVVLPIKPIFEGKFIQFYFNGQPFFRIGDKNSVHGILLLNFLDEAKIPFQLFSDDAGGISVSPRGDGYELVGAGIIDGDGKDFLLYGWSRSYNSHGPNQKHLEALAQHLPEGIKLTIRNS